MVRLFIYIKLNYDIVKLLLFSVKCKSISLSQIEMQDRQGIKTRKYRNKKKKENKIYLKIY